MNTNISGLFFWYLYSTDSNDNLCLFRRDGSKRKFTSFIEFVTLNLPRSGILFKNHGLSSTDSLKSVIVDGSSYFLILSRSTVFGSPAEISVKFLIRLKVIPQPFRFWFILVLIVYAKT